MSGAFIRKNPCTYQIYIKICRITFMLFFQEAEFEYFYESSHKKMDYY